MNKQDLGFVFKINPYSYDPQANLLQHSNDVNNRNSSQE